MPTQPSPPSRGSALLAALRRPSEPLRLRHRCQPRLLAALQRYLELRRLALGSLCSCETGLELFNFGGRGGKSGGVRLLSSDGGSLGRAPRAEQVGLV